jgi:hypothetical protein
MLEHHTNLGLTRCTDSNCGIVTVICFQMLLEVDMKDLATRVPIHRMWMPFVLDFLGLPSVTQYLRLVLSPIHTPPREVVTGASNGCLRSL